MAAASGAALGCPSDDGAEVAPPDEDAAVVFDAQAPADADPATAEDAAFVPCPAPAGDRDNPDELFDLASELKADAKHGAAITCADIAAELVPSAVEAHQVRAESLAALGRHDEARRALARALAHDPDDPETLLAAADYYIGDGGGGDRESKQLGMIYAERGLEAARAMWPGEDEIRAELHLRVAQAKNDLGRPQGALRAAERALELGGDPVRSHYERAVSLFSAAAFDEAEAAFEAVLEAGDSDREAHAHYHIGLIFERRGEDDEAAEALERASALSEGALGPGVEVSPGAFRERVDEAIASLPSEERALARQVEIELEDLPDIRDLESEAPPLSPTMLGLFRGLPRGESPPHGDGEGVGDAGEAPPERAIVLYRKNLARTSADHEELGEHIRDTLRHEIGHLMGLSEAELRRRGLE